MFKKNQSSAACTTGLLATLLLSAGAYAAGDRHQHGASQLDVSIESDALTLQWASPLSDLIGFEHAPRTAPQKATAQQLLKTLKDPASLSVPNPEAQCSVVSVSVQAPGLAPAQAKAPAKAGHGSEDAHSDLAYTVRYSCKKASALRTLTLNAFKTWPAIQDIDIALVGPGGQAAQEAKPNAARIDLRAVAAPKR